MELNFEIIGQRIRYERNERKWLISQLSQHTGLSVAHISSMERGKCNFSVESLISIAKALKLDVNYLLFGESKIDSDISKDLQQVINDCNNYEVNILIESAKCLKEVLRNNNR